jgi:hypothetical protein
MQNAILVKKENLIVANANKAEMHIVNLKVLKCSFVNAKKSLFFKLKKNLQ